MAAFLSSPLNTYLYERSNPVYFMGYLAFSVDLQPVLKPTMPTRL